jgi:hypothetical protein
MADMSDVKFFKFSAKHQLDYWNKKVQEIKDGTFQSDGSILMDCYVPLVYRKVEIFTEAMEFLDKLDDDYIIYDKHHVSPEYSQYMKIVNS